MTKEEAIQALRELLEPGESVTVESKRLGSLTANELSKIYSDAPGGIGHGLLITVMKDRQREVERMRERWGGKLANWCDVAEFLGVEVEL